MAMARNSTMMAIPKIAPLRRISRRSARRSGDSTASALLSRAAVKGASVMASAAQPRIDEDIGDIGEKIEHDIDRRGHQNDALYHGVVAVEHRIDDQLAETWNGENLLGQH